jgi:hypothetical protein
VTTGHLVCGPIRRYWEAGGGLPQFGDPLSAALPMLVSDEARTLTVQYFERARFEYHPEHAGTPDDVQLGRLGWQVYQGA